MLEANAFSDYALVPLGSSAQCYWKPDCSFDQFLYLVKNLQLTDAPFVTEALGWSNIQDNRAIHVNSPVAQYKVHLVIWRHYQKAVGTNLRQR